MICQASSSHRLAWHVSCFVFCQGCLADHSPRNYRCLAFCEESCAHHAAWHARYLVFFQGITWFRLVPGPACCVSRSLAPPNAVNTRVYGPGSVAGLVGPFPHYHKPCLEAHFLRRASPKHLGYAKLLQRSPAQPPSKTLLWFPPQCTISKSWRRYTGTSYDVSEAWRSDNERPIALDSKLLALLAGTHGLMCQAKFEEDLYYARHFGALF